MDWNVCVRNLYGEAYFWRIWLPKWLLLKKITSCVLGWSGTFKGTWSDQTGDKSLNRWWRWWLWFWVIFNSSELLIDSRDITSIVCAIKQRKNWCGNLVSDEEDEWEQLYNSCLEWVNSKCGTHEPATYEALDIQQIQCTAYCVHIVCY